LENLETRHLVPASFFTKLANKTTFCGPDLGFMRVVVEFPKTSPSGKQTTTSWSLRTPQDSS
jgi:hypothetical protein